MGASALCRLERVSEKAWKWEVTGDLSEVVCLDTKDDAAAAAAVAQDVASPLLTTYTC